MSPRSAANARVEVHVAQSCRSEVWSAASLRSIVQKCCSEVSLTDLCVEMLPELSGMSLRSVAYVYVCVCVKCKSVA